MDPLTKPGYKQTELGWIPEDWVINAIKNFASITTGSKNTQDKIADGDYPFFVRSQTIERINSYSFEGEAVLTAGDGVGTGKIFHYINGKFDIHQRVYKISDFDFKVNGYFFYLYFSISFYDRMMQMTAKSSVDSVRREMIANMNIPIPPIKEQTAIATALSDMDGYISSLEKLIAKKRLIKQGAMQELLTPKKDWEVKPIGDLVSITTGSKNAQDKVDDGEYPFFVRSQSIEKINSFSFDGEAVLTAGDGVGTGKIFHYIKGKFDLHQRVYKMSDFSENLDGYYFYLYFSENFFDRIMQMTAKSSVDSVRREMISKMVIPFPSLKQQQEISNTFREIDREILSLEKKLLKARQLKQGMMQELLTGRTRFI